MKHTCKISVRFSDTDKMGHVNNSRYFTFMEEARIQFLSDIARQNEDELPLIMASAQVNFRAQTFYPGLLRVESWVSRWGRSSFDVTCEMYDDQSGELCFDATTVLVYFDYERQKTARVPEIYRERLEAYTEA